MSSLVWICTSTQKVSKVTVIDANNPADILEVFNVCQSHLLCIASVPGAKESDYLQNNDDSSLRLVNGNAAEIVNNQRANDGVTIVEEITTNQDKNCLKTFDSEDRSQTISEDPLSFEGKPSEDSEKIADNDPSSNTEPQSLKVDSESVNLGKLHFVKCTVENLVNEKSYDGGEDEIKADSNEGQTAMEKMSSIQPTMWLGAQDGAVYVHSAVAKWSMCLHTVKLKDAALSIV